MPSLYQTVVPVFIRNLKVLSILLAKADAHAAVSNEQLLSSRLIGDMENLTFQIRVATLVARNIAVHLGKFELPELEDSEKTIGDFQERITKIIKTLESIQEDKFVGDDEVVTFNIGTGDLKATGKDYVLKLATPNFYFHFVTAYDILRKEGVQIGKKDYLQWWDGVDNIA